ncbi:MAG: IPT/TIG domain-containing protein [Chloroflexus sp.]
MKPDSFNLFIRAMTAVGLVAVLFIGVGFIQPRMARANVPPSACSATPLFTNGTFVTGIGNGAGGADTSSPVSPDTGFGYLVDPTRTQTTPDGVNRARLADDFTVTGNGWRPSAITLYTYQIDSTTTSPITGVINLRLWDGTPGDGGTVIAGPVDGIIISNQWTNVYRVPANNLLQTDRPIMAVTIQWPFGNASLLPGTYWLEWGIAGDAALSGPWTPPTNAAVGDNARQLNLTGGDPGTWTARADYSSGRVVGLPFVICGDSIPTPQITSLGPSSATADGSAFTLTVNGSGFIDGSGSDRSIVYWNGSPRSTTFVSSTQLTAAIAAIDIATAGTVNVTVVNPGNVTSNTVTFTIENPVPTLTSMSPATATAGGAGVTLTVTGTNFVNGSVVRWNGSDRPTTFGSATTLQASISASDLATAGTASVTVFTPGPGGGETSGLTFTIQSSNPSPTIPTITSVSPDSITVGTTDITLTINGNNFENGAVVRWNGTALATTFVSATQLTATLPAAQRSGAGIGNVTVVNPGGGESNPVTTTIRYHVSVPIIMR